MPDGPVVLSQPGDGAPGPLIASGRAADVYAYGDRSVLRRYRTDHDCLHEAAVMQHVRSHGYPAPDVISASGRDLVMERIEGPTMLRRLSARPFEVVSLARTLASLQERLHAIAPAPWMTRKHDSGDAIVHLDLHPDNVIMSPSGPVVIDWSNAGIGDPLAELADLWLLLSSAVVPGSLLDRTVAAIGRGLFVRSIFRHVDRDAVRTRLAIAAHLRSQDRNMSPAELGRMQRLVERFAT